MAQLGNIDALQDEFPWLQLSQMIIKIDKDTSTACQ